MCRGVLQSHDSKGYTIHFRKQINSTGIKNIIDELVTGYPNSL